MQRYDITRTYDWNYQCAPGRPPEIEAPACPGQWDFCGLPVGSPLGVPAGPLLNSRWILYYAALGFSVLTYKTVRSRFRACYQPPNLLPVRSGQLSDETGRVLADPEAASIRSWAISFGMPSKDPPVWQQDVERARRGLGRDQVLVVSVVASPEEGWTLDQIAADFALLARQARDAGAQAVEANLSCPNVCTQEGQLYHWPEASAAIAAAMRHQLGDLPLILKIGLFANRDQAAQFVPAVQPYASALNTTNSISAAVRGPDDEPLFGGLRRGIGGECIRDRCLAELAMLGGLTRGVPLIAVGGVSTAADVRDRLQAGAHHVQIATAAMLDPLVGIRIRQQLWSPAAH